MIGETSKRRFWFAGLSSGVIISGTSESPEPYRNKYFAAFAVSDDLEHVVLSHEAFSVTTDIEVHKRNRPVEKATISITLHPKYWIERRNDIMRRIGGV